MSDPGEVWAIIPVKETRGAKQRLAPLLPAPLRQALALAMLEDVLEAVAGVTGWAARSWSPSIRRPKISPAATARRRCRRRA
jgi:hypothetical protein